MVRDEPFQQPLTAKDPLEESRQGRELWQGLFIERAMHYFWGKAVERRKLY